MTEAYKLPQAQIFPTPAPPDRQPSGRRSVLQIKLYCILFYLWLKPV